MVWGLMTLGTYDAVLMFFPFVVLLWGSTQMINFVYLNSNVSDFKWIHRLNVIVHVRADISNEWWYRRHPCIFIEVHVPCQESESVYVCYGYWFYLFLPFSIGFWNCSDNMLYFCFHFIHNKPLLTSTCCKFSPLFT